MRDFDPEVSPHVEVPEIPIRPAAATQSTHGELSLRAPEHEPASGPTSPNQNANRNPQPVWLPVTAALAIGILGGFAVGYVVGQRDATPAPHAAERPAARDRIASGPSQSERPAPTAGRDFTDSAVAQPGAAGPSQSGASAAQPVPDAPVIPPPESSGPVPSVEAPVSGPPVRSVPAEPGSLQVDSRPRGARVFLDGRLVGTTPVVISDVAPGPHAVRIDLAGHRRWVTQVEVEPGERHRVAASLER